MYFNEFKLNLLFMGSKWSYLFEFLRESGYSVPILLKESEMFVHFVEGLNVFGRQLKVPNGKVFFQSFGIHTLRNWHGVRIQCPSDQDLPGSFSVLLRDSDDRLGSQEAGSIGIYLCHQFGGAKWAISGNLNSIVSAKFNVLCLKQVRMSLKLLYCRLHFGVAKEIVQDYLQK